MSSNSFTKENLDNYLKELAKEYRKLGGKNMPAEIVLVGGAAILTNYGFRDMTTAVDAIVRASSSMKDPINLVGDKFDLPKDSKSFIENALKNGGYEEIYQSVKAEEKQSKELLIEFEEEYKNVANVSNVDDILRSLKAKR